MGSRTATASGTAAAVIQRLVGFSCRHAWPVLLAACALTALSGYFLATRFRINTDLDAVLDASLPWRLEAAHLEAEFPQLGEDISIIIDGATSEIAEQAARDLQQALSAQVGQFESVERSNGGPFFDQEGLLYGSVQEVEHSTQALIAAQPLLAQVASDSSVRGLLHSLELGLSQAKSSPRHMEAVDRAAASMVAVLAHAEDSKPRYLSWRSLLGEQAVDPNEWRQFIAVIPSLDHASTSPALEARRAIRSAALRLGLDPAHGVRMRLTGTSVIADEELATLAESSGWIACLMLVCMIAVLYAATRSVRAVLAMLLTTAAGAIMTGAVGLGLVAQFTLISVAFLPLFVGLGIDFCIQFHARAGMEASDTHLATRLSRAGAGIGSALALAAVAIAVAFMAFLPTAYRGVSELGLIAGIGIVIALILSLSLLPALLVVLRTPVPIERAPRLLKGVDAMLTSHRRAFLCGALVLAVAGAAILPRLKVNFDPMALRSPKTESVSAYYELAGHVDTTPNTISVLAPTSAAADDLARRLKGIPEVGAVLTLQSLVPEHQSEKLAYIAEARDLLDLSLNPFTTVDPPSDEEAVTALHRCASNLKVFVGDNPSSRDSLLRLAGELERIAHVDHLRRNRAVGLLMQGLPLALSQIAKSLSAEPVDVSTLPPHLHRQWQATDGSVRVEIAPAKPLLDAASTERFVAAVRKIAPNAAGDAVTIVESKNTVLGAFASAGLISAISIAGLLGLALRSFRGVVLALAPVMLAGILTFGSCAALGLSINLENLIALPLLLGIGVAFNIYCVMVWRSGAPVRLASNLGRGIIFSALTTGTSFATLTFSSHPGTSSMGLLLLIALGWIVATSLLITPALAARIT